MNLSSKQKIIVLRVAFSVTATIVLGVVNLKDPWWLKLILYFIPYIAVGYDVLARAFKNIKNKSFFDEKLLMTIATIGAFVIGEYPEGVMVMAFFQTGELFEKLAVGKSRASISELMDIIPDKANLCKEGRVIEVSPDEVSKGDIILVRPGEKIPLDGVITEGETYVDTAALTGESMPRRASVNHKVASGFVNMQGLIYVKVENEFYESTATKILEIVESATLKKAKTEAFITKFARYYTPAVVIGAVLISTMAAILTGEIFESLRRGLVFLVVSCPCALVISVPLSFFGGIGGASKQGILIKGSEYIEALSKTDIAVFDKTGTLTEGRFTINKIKVTGNIKAEDLMEYAAYAEYGSTHPIAKCICSAYTKEFNVAKVTEMTEYTGGGVGIKYNGRIILVGNEELMAKNHIEICKQQEDVGSIVIYVAIDGSYVGNLVLRDKLKENSQIAIEKIKEMGVSKTVMLTGDISTVAESIGKELEIDEVHSRLMPADKVDICEKLMAKKKKGGTLMFAGDGINDAPVISRADVGIAMGAMGSDAAIEAADVVVMDDDPEKISKAIDISKKTMGIVKQNIIFALFIKGVVLLLGALGFANMWLAVFADVGVSVIAILNAMRTLRISSKK